MDVSHIRRSHMGTTTDPLVDQAVAQLERRIEQLKLLKGSGPEVAKVLEEAEEMWGDQSALWLVRHNRVLGATPVELMLQGRTAEVVRLMLQIAHGVYP
jgi:hypothetical protein